MITIIALTVLLKVRGVKKKKTHTFISVVPLCKTAKSEGEKKNA